jgi:EAL domain-containing protein (putative c-di-GMP-specific phosphodiesterase class I)
MARLSRPRLPPGPIDDLVKELHALHARAGLPSTRLLARGQEFTYTTVHDLFTKTSSEPPRLPVLLRIVEQLARRAPRMDVQETLDKFDGLWRAADEEAISRRPVREESVSARRRDPTWRLGGVELPDERATRTLQRAIGLGELYLTYQPIYNREQEVARVEAFVRCRASDGSTIRADTLIPAALRAGVLAEVDLWVLYTAARDAASWPTLHGNVPRIAVNMSAEIGCSEDLEDAIVEVVLSTGVALSSLSVEVEDAALRRFSASKLAKLDYLTSRGMELALDDFGRGYETFAGLDGLPIQAIKIDDSVVRQIPTKPAELTIARTIVKAAADQGIVTIATGIETVEQLDLLRSIGVQGYQGHVFGLPVSSTELPDVLSSGRTGSVRP